MAKPKVFAAIIDYLTKHSTLSAQTEITIEANPTSVESSKFKEFKAAGINRLSLGIQSLNDEDLKFLGREHSSAQASQAIDTARNIFSNYSFDLIYTLPQQTLKQWERELTNALKFVEQHVSLYQLTIEKGTPFFKDFRNKKFVMPDDDLSADFYELTNSIMTAHGYNRYEVSNYARKGGECLHNLCYWEYKDYLGIGPGAHGRYENEGIKYATIMLHSPQSWINKVSIDGIGLQHIETLTSEQIRQETIIMGLRLQKGIAQHLITNQQKLQEFCELGLIELADGLICATEKGFLVLNTLISNLLSKGKNRSSEICK